MSQVRLLAHLPRPCRRGYVMALGFPRPVLRMRFPRRVGGRGARRGALRRCWSRTAGCCFSRLRSRAPRSIAAAMRIAGGRPSRLRGPTFTNVIRSPTLRPSWRVTARSVRRGGAGAIDGPASHSGLSDEGAFVPLGGEGSSGETGAVGALAVDVAQIPQQVRQGDLRGRAARGGATIEALDARAQLLLALAQGPIIPIQRAHGAVDDPVEQVADRARHELPTLMAAQRRGGLLQHLRHIGRQLHAR